MNGIRIKRNKDFEIFTFTHEEDLQDKVNEQGEGAFKILEEFDCDEKHYKVYGYDQGDNFNQFDLFYKTARGDLLIVATNLNGNVYKNASFVDVDAYYSQYEDLDDTLIFDELYRDGDYYEFTDDSFIIDDRLESIDYPDLNSDDECEMLGIDR